MAVKRIIAIDPDVDESAWAMIEKSTKTLEYGKLRFPDLLEKLTVSDSETSVFVEAGWMAGISNYHGIVGRRGQRVAKNVGANHQVGKLIIECLEHDGVDVEPYHPLRKCWKGKDGKITHDELACILRNGGYGALKRCNQDVRDAILLAYVLSNEPMIMKP